MKYISISVLLFVVFASGCVGGNYYNMGKKQFTSKVAAIDYQRQTQNLEIERVEPGEYFGGSLIIHVPTNENLSQLPFVTGNPNQDLIEYFRMFYIQDFEGVKNAIVKSKMFDSVATRQMSSYLRYSKNHGYRYLLVNNGDGTWTFYDLYLGKDKNVRFPKGLDNLVYLIEDTISKFEKEKPSKSLSAGYNVVGQSLEYDDKTKRGKLSIHGKGIEARSWMLMKIGQIASSKNILLKSGMQPDAGYFEVLNEKIANNVFTIEFRATY